MEPNAQTIATFTGTLLRREYTASQRFIQLIFRENDQDWLCVSSNADAAQLAIGQDYRIEGEFKQVGSRQFIHEPFIEPLKQGGRRLLPVLIVVGVILALSGVATAAVLVPKHHAAGVATSTAITQTSQEVPATQDTAPATTTDQSAPAAATTPTTPTTPATTTTTKKTTPLASPVAPVITATAYCDPVTTIPFGYSTISDPNQPDTYSSVTTPGVTGQQQTCYPTGQASSAQTTVLAAPQDQVTTVGTQPTGP